MIISNFKIPQRPEQLNILKLLQTRIKLSEKHLREVQRLESGYKGEVYFYSKLVEKTDPSALIVNNLTLMYENSQIQIDSLLIIENHIYLFEVKNYKGDFYIKEDNWFTGKTKSEINNPLIQLNRTRYLLEKILHINNINFNIHPYLIFTNKEFTLYHEKINNQIIFPTQIPRLLRHLKKNSFKQQKKHYNLLNFFEENNIRSNIYTNPPKYTFNQLKKGIYCWHCRQPLIRKTERMTHCKKCKKDYNNTLAIVNNVEEFKMLFPNKKVTTSLIEKWCKGLFPIKTIRRIMTQVYKQIGKNKGSYYISDETDQNYEKILKKIKNPYIYI